MKKSCFVCKIIYMPKISDEIRNEKMPKMQGLQRANMESTLKGFRLYM